MAVKMAAEKFGLTTFVILLTVFVTFLDRKLMANISIILPNNCVVQVPKIRILAGQLKTNLMKSKCVFFGIIHTPFFSTSLLLFPLLVSIAAAYLYLNSGLGRKLQLPRFSNFDHGSPLTLFPIKLSQYLDQ